MSKQHEYTNGEITVVWQADLCTHSGNCVRNLGQVFKPGDKPWIKIANASTDEIAATVAKCPSGALSVRANEK